jgi:hypothetical protein
MVSFLFIYWIHMSFQVRFCIKKACFFHELVQWFFLQAMLFIDMFIPLHDYFGSFSLL